MKFILFYEYNFAFVGRPLTQQDALLSGHLMAILLKNR